jgi:response regulator NasT
VALREQAYSLLVVSASEKFNDIMASLLPEMSFSPVGFAGSISEAQRKSAEQSFDIIVVNSPLADDMGIRFAIDSSTSSNALVLILAKNETFTDVYEKVERYGVFTLSKPISKQSIVNALRWMITTKTRLENAEKKTVKMENKMEEIRLVNKAKWLLISKEGLLEPEAHRYLEKEAMDRCVSKRVIAEEIIKKHS